MLTDKGIEAIRNRLKNATPGPWEWTAAGERPQLEGKIEYAEMNPILVAAGCGNKRKKKLVYGCMPEKLNDELRACPLHPFREDREFIAHAYSDIEILLDYITTLHKESYDIQRHLI